MDRVRRAVRPARRRRGGRIAWYVLRPQPAAEAVQEGEGEGQGGEGEAAQPKPIEPTGIIALEQFLVNLADKDASGSCA